MQPLGDAELVGLWERGSSLHPLDRALLALAAALPGIPHSRLADWPLGQRNQALARLHGLCFGPVLRGWTACAKCGEKLEFEMNTQALTDGPSGEKSSSDQAVTVNDRTFRLPTSRDLAHIARETDPTAGAVRLVERCLVGMNPPAVWTGDDLSAISDQLALADPLAESRLALQCPNCANEWQDTLEIGLFFWTALEARVRQVLHAIHTLASAYGWTEANILSLGEKRRARYLELALS